MKVQLITTNKRLKSELNRMIEKYTEIWFAVAWASAGHEVFEALLQNAEKIQQGIIGTHFYQTHPDVIDALRRQRVRFMLQPNGVFHPKVYVFRSDSEWEALIGSANFTAGAMETNSEVMVRLRGDGITRQRSADRLIRLIEGYWENAEKINALQARAYRNQWWQRQPALRRLAGLYGPHRPRRTPKNPLESRILSMSWAEYYRGVQKEKERGAFSTRLKLLRRVQDLFGKDETFGKMSDDARKLVAGLPNDLYDGAGWFGSMGGNGRFAHAVGANNGHLSESLDCIPLRGQVSRAEYDAYIEEFIQAFPNGGHGAAVASRLLAMRRPDQFVCLDSANRARLCGDFGITQNGMDYARYWEEIIERIRDAPWWNAKRPADRIQAAVWDGRVAMLDTIFYDHE